MKKYKLGIIGMGNMASAIAGGVMDSFFLNNEDICFYETDKKKALKSSQVFKINLCNETREVFMESEYVLLSFKPQNLKESSSLISEYFEIDGNILLSVLAGVPIKYFERLISKKAKIARIMPNAPVLINKGISAISFSPNINSGQKDFVKKMFGCIGKTVIIDEKFQNLVTALSGSSPAYFYLICKYMTNFGIERGVDEDTAKELVIGSMLGSGAMLDNISNDFDEMIRKVASKGGTTEKALESFKDNNLKEIIFDAMGKALERAYEMEDSLSKF
ncbi:MAG TPA: pyrroline-5-carboxylate reductase [Actinobacteria bacterium]|jgi:pyrroline-5-carboxylate reductase|nr:pyrroline-5-carboxylate reductase [Actinomycetota bacterium]